MSGDFFKPLQEKAKCRAYANAKTNAKLYQEELRMRMDKSGVLPCLRKYAPIPDRCIQYVNLCARVVTSSFIRFHHFHYFQNNQTVAAISNLNLESQRSCLLSSLDCWFSSGRH